jgi:hypothetical protein
LLAAGIEPSAIDLTALWKFAGLTLKVRHNGLRNNFPKTFRLMSLTGVEITLFASYATFCSSTGRSLAPTSEGRALDFVAFLKQTLDFDTRNHILLWDLIRYEQALALLAKPVSSRPCRFTTEHSGPIRTSLSGSTVPKIRGATILHEMQCDPVVVGRLLFQNPPRLDQIPLQVHHYCYWRPDLSGGIQILELDEFGYYALCFVDGTRSTAELSVRLGGKRRPTAGFLRSLSQLAAIGVLDFKGTPTNCLI